uniref:Structure-specific endonuclease subunit SLX1 homolog n=1 Tax=Strigamia maritima TaxID=126957 RepID=T1JPD7_STRMM
MNKRKNVSETKMGDTVEDFYGCYLLVSENEKYKNYTYIGFTVDPNRRITQHNKGIKSGGAKWTNNKGPWNMILIVHGFPNEISALRFEWAWQHPHKSTRLRNLKKKTTKETRLDFKFRILGEMLTTGPWNRLPLTIRWLMPKYAVQFKVQPPIHMPITQGDVTSKKINKSHEIINENVICRVCDITFCHRPPISFQDPKDKFECFLPNCDMKAHILCLVKDNSEDFLIPVEISCPKCFSTLLWGDLVRHRKGCYRNLNT